MKESTYIAIDLKSFYASVECVERGLDPLKAHLVVADESRTEKTICLAVTPALKAYGISGRARLFEVVQQVRKVNATKRYGEAKLEFIIAPPQMARYMEVSRQIYSIYLKYVSSEDIHPYSVDEVFIDATQYLDTYGISAHEFAMRMIRDVLSTTGITATAGIGPNLYLAKVAMDVEAKHREADSDGVRIAELSVMDYRRKYWTHRPMTDFWRLGPGIAARLESNGMFTLGDVARCSLERESLLYKLFGVNAELIIDHAWGHEPCTLAAIKNYRPSTKSMSSGQVLSRPYTWQEGKVIAREMVDSLILDLVEKKFITDQIVLTVCYDIDNLTDKNIRYKGPTVIDHYGRLSPKPAHGTARLGRHSSSTKAITDATMKLYDRIVDKSLLVRRLYVVAANLRDERLEQGIQLDLFQDKDIDTKERKRQEAILAIRRKYGKNAILKGTNFDQAATAIERNNQIGGHKAK